MNKKLLLIVNPNAGRMKANEDLLALVDEFTKNKYDANVYPTKKKSDAEKKIIKCGGDYDLIVCYGGDGTVSEVVNGVAKLELDQPVPFSFIPSGTANDFAMTVSMPTDINLAVKKIIRGKERPIDIGKFNSKHFIYVAAFGLFTSVSYTVPQDLKKTFGHLSYVMEGIRQAIDVTSYKMTVEFGEKTVKDEFVLGLVTNTTSVAGMFRLSNAKVKLDDGEFELLLVRNPGNPILLSNILLDLSAQKYDPEYVIFERVSKVKFRSDESEPIAWCLDGENGGVHKRVIIENLHRKGIIRL